MALLPWGQWEVELQPRINGELVLPPSDAMGDGTVVKD